MSIAKNRTCTANYWKSDTLLINIMNSNGYIGDGFSIQHSRKNTK